MPAGAANPTPLALYGGASADLQSPALPSPATSRAFALAAGPGAGARTAVQQQPVAGSHAGAWAPGHDGQWFERIHVVPRRADLGNLIGEQALAVEVWSAYRSAHRSLVSITVLGSAGVVVDSPPSLPLLMPPFEADVYSVRALAIGDGLIDNLVVWGFYGIPTEGTTLILVGNRIVPFPFSANFADPITERYGYLTDVLKARTDREQRVQLRARPRRGLEFSVWLEEREAEHASALLYGWQPYAFGVPFWQYSERLTVSLAIGGTLVLVDTADVPWQAGDIVFLWADPWTWEAITVDAVASGQLTLRTPAQKAWPAGSSVAVPLGIGRLGNSETLDWEMLRAGSGRLAFSMDTAA